ncbi:hypothetical protein L195_g020900 [Trifolium pratense]|uniref:Uncharacterized protein n=1 Tax=Trifolium pratense TaxID=57577 RepID=A0A2K3N3R3_TRIPR|nr:hypothetical protein L195_g020900 [Trifolium pratense]
MTTFKGHKDTVATNDTAGAVSAIPQYVVAPVRKEPAHVDSDCGAPSIEELVLSHHKVDTVVTVTDDNDEHVDNITKQVVVDYDFTVPETQLQQVVIDDMEKIKQAWLSRARELEVESESFTPVISKAKKKHMRLAKNASSYHIRSKDQPPSQ